MYKHQRLVVTNLIASAKTSYYSSKIIKNSGDQKVLFKIIDKLANRKQSSPLPTYNDSKELANRFGEFFINKIKKIQDGLNQLGTVSDNVTIIEEKKDLNKNFLVSHQSQSKK